MSKINSIGNSRIVAAARIGVVAAVWLGSVAGAGAGETVEFPLRAKYPELATISTEVLAAQLAKIELVDVRTDMEFKVIHANGAHNIPVTGVNFVAEVGRLRAKDDESKKLVFYCNGHTCEKSYLAANALTQAGFKNLAVYDAGVFAWVKAHPDQGTLMGASPIDAKLILTPAQLQARIIEAKEFLAEATKNNGIVIDLRDPLQRKAIPDYKGLRSIPMDRLVVILKEKHLLDAKRPLYFMDAVGHQIVWLQYYLEKDGYKDYYFLKGGVAALDLKEMRTSISQASR